MAKSVLALRIAATGVICSVIIVSVTWAEDAEPVGEQASVQAYVDQYFSEEELAAQPEDDLLEEDPGEPTFIGAAYRYYRDAQSGADTLDEHGVEFRWRRESLKYGELEFQADTLFASGSPERDFSGQRFLLGQRGFALNENLLLDNTLGHFRSITPGLVSASYRFYLPSTLLQGIDTRLHSDRTSISFTAGQIGEVSGIAARAFDRSSGNMLGASSVHNFNRQWTAAGQFWRTDGARDVPDHSAYAGALQYADEAGELIQQVRYLRDSQSNNGVWYDGFSRTEDWTYRYGIFHFDPRLLWTDIPIQNDLQGLYWRGDFRSFRWRWTLGSEVTRNNLDDDDSIAGNITTQSFANASWQFRRKTQLGGFLSLATQHADSGTAEDDGHVVSLRGFTSQQFDLGLTRLESRVTRQNLPTEELTEFEVRWDQDWAIRYLDRFTTGASYLRDTGGGDDYLIGAIGEKIITPTLRVSGQVQSGMREDEFGVESDNTNFSLGLSWEPTRNFLAALTATVNRDNTDLVDGEELEGTDSTVLLTFSYAKSSGQRPLVYGADRGGKGAGRITGTVFLDGNRDGRISVGEETVSGLVVYLDGGFSTRTDQEGRFEFWPVQVGEHQINIALEDVPLPWGLEDEAARTITVSARGETRIEFGLIRLNE